MKLELEYEVAGEKNENPDKCNVYDALFHDFYLDAMFLFEITKYGMSETNSIM